MNQPSPESQAVEAGVYDYLLGGTNNSPVDREMAELTAAAAGGIDNSRNAVRANRLFLGRAVRYLVQEAGVCQFLDLGTGYPTVHNVHQVAQALTPDARVVYVDHDAMVAARAQALLTGTAEAPTTFLHADMRDAGAVLNGAADTLDFSQPVAVMIVAMLHFFADDEDPHAFVDRYLERMPSGSYLVISHLASDIQLEAIADLADAVAQNPHIAFNFHPRTRAEVARFFEGLELIEPGVVQVDEWRPQDSASPPRPPGVGKPPIHVAMGRKP